MKIKWGGFVGMGIMAALLASTVPVEASVVESRVYFWGTLRNTASKQSLRGVFRGNGEFGLLDLDVKLSGTVLSQPSTRTPEKTLLGKYPVEVSLRVGKSGISASKSFGTNVRVYRRSISVPKVGKIILSRSINPRKKGPQRISGRGNLRYNF